MAIPQFLKTFVTTAKDIAMNKQTVSGPPGSSHRRMVREEVVKRERPESRKDFFRGKHHLNRREIRDRFKKASASVPVGGKYTEKQRIALEEELFPKEKYGTHLTPPELSGRKRLFRGQIYKARTVAGKIKIRTQKRFLESVTKEIERND